MRLSERPLELISWSDLQRLVGVPEDQHLDFKLALSEKGGQQKPWESSGGLGAQAKKALAKSVCAFANAYGGDLIVGMGETEDKPSRGSVLVSIPEIGALEEQLESFLRSGYIDPPIGGLQVRGVQDPSIPGAGAIVVRVPSSGLAPHGFGSPPAAFVRRGTMSQPMTMRDIQNTFWDARVRSERISAQRARHSSEIREATTNMLLHREAGKNAISHPGVYVRISAYPHWSLELRDLEVKQDWVRLLRLEKQVFAPPGDIAAAVFGDGLVNWSLRPRAHGVHTLSPGPSRWTIYDSGAIEISGFKEAHKMKNSALFVMTPEWFVIPVAQVIAMIEELRRRSQRPGVPFEIDIELIRAGAVESWVRHGDWETEGDKLEAVATIGPFIYETRARAEDLVKEIERQLFFACGLPTIRSLNLSFDRAWAYIDSKG